MVQPNLWKVLCSATNSPPGIWGHLAADCHPRTSANQESDFMHLIYALDDGLKPPCNLQSLW